jgi:glycine/D-amino acid oxidase-like deaminating enzyme/nitrite reductase/ring-hydroxylating ferredoxin subunit
MTDTTSAAGSLWLDTAPATDYPALSGDLEVDVAVIGGGIAGLTTALLLRRAGASVAVLEAGRVGTGVTGCSTAKVTALQSTVYSTIRRRHGVEGTEAYAAASRAGVEQLAALVAEESIECAFDRRDAITYAASPAETSSVEKEYRVTAQAGLPVELVDDVDVPFPTYGAVRLADQVQIQPVRYVQGLAAAVDGNGSAVFEQTRVLGVEEGSPCRVRTAQGTVRAGNVVVTTHYPMLDRGLYFARLEPQRSYCIGARLADGAVPPRSMSINAGSPTRSLRSDGDLLIVGGESHTAGARSATPERFERLEAFARDHWNIDEISYRWSAQDPSHYDHLPVIGPYRPGASRLWVASGFMKWGFSSATFAARILADGITGRPNEWAAAFSPNRLSVRSLHETAALGVKFTADLVGDRLLPAGTRSVREIPPGEARVVGDGHGRTGIYRDESGTLHGVSVRCTHMGCLLRFNSAETSWDCPCHGSRFDVDGTVLEGPAVHPLERRDV